MPSESQIWMNWKIERERPWTLPGETSWGHGPSQDWQVSQGEESHCTRGPGLLSLARALGHRGIDVSE